MVLRVLDNDFLVSPISSPDVDVLKRTHQTAHFLGPRGLPRGLLLADALLVS